MSEMKIAPTAHVPQSKSKPKSLRFNGNDRIDERTMSAHRIYMDTRKKVGSAITRCSGAVFHLLLHTIFNKFSFLHAGDGAHKKW
jgi:hypothetical protein